MTNRTAEATQLITARVAGFLYLAVVVSGILSLMYIPSKLMVLGDATATVNNIVAFEQLFRLGIVGELIYNTLFIFLPLVLYKLLKPVNKNYALLMVILALIIVPISYVNILNKLAILTLLSGADYLNVFEANQLHAQVMLFLGFYKNGILIVQIFWGLWLFPFGYLVFKSGFIPRILGVLLMLGCFGYLITFTGFSLFSTGFRESIISNLVTVPGSLGEIGTMLWLLIIGVRLQKPGEGNKGTIKA